MLVTDERGTPEPERSVARVTVTTDAGLLPVVVDFVRRVARRLGLTNRAAEHLDLAVQTVCRNVIRPMLRAGVDAGPAALKAAAGGGDRRQPAVVGDLGPERPQGRDQGPDRPAEQGRPSGDDGSGRGEGGP